MELEGAYGALEQVFENDLPGAPPIPSWAVPVVIFENPEAMEKLFPGYRGLFSTRRSGGEEVPTIVASGTLDDHTLLLVRHELTHRFVHHYLPIAPAWLNEGLAQVYSTVETKHGEVVVGGWHRDLDAHGYQPNVREVLNAVEKTFHDENGFYNEAHALVHLLQSERREYRSRFVSYLRQLASGYSRDRAWGENFTGIDLDRLEREVNGYRFITLRIDTRRIPASAPVPVTVELHAMTDDDVHRTWTEIRNTNKP